MNIIINMTNALELKIIYRMAKLATNINKLQGVGIYFARQAQEKIAQLVAEQWTKEGGRGIAVNKQNLFRYLKNEGGSEKYTAYVMQLSGAIVAAMPIEIARKHGLSNARTEAELVASAIKECSEAHQAKLLGAPLQKLEKEIREAAIALFNMLPADAAGPLLASISAVAPQFF
jgi:hypothetical protein